MFKLMYKKIITLYAHQIVLSGSLLNGKNRTSMVAALVRFENEFDSINAWSVFLIICRLGFSFKITFKN